MSEFKYQTKEEVLSRALEAVGLTFRDIDNTGRIITGKGAIGTVIEESWFGYNVNSDSEPDFIEAGVELKATPYIHTRKGIRAKERLVCGIINYMKEFEKDFLSSSFWHKCKTILIMSYEYKKNIPKEDYTVDKAILFSFPEEDLVIIKQDWENIITKVRAGRAHELSEGDTLYLAASTKGATSSSIREQPFSEIWAKQRAYSLKQSYMTSVLNRFIFGHEENERIIKNPMQLKGMDFIDFLESKFKPYFGMSQNKLKEMFGIKSTAKSLNRLIASAILNVVNIEKSDEFQKADIKIKTIRIEAKGYKIAESMSFPAFKFNDIINQDWEDSLEYQNFVEQKYLFMIFRKDIFYNNDKKNKKHTEDHLFFDSILIWQLPEEDEAEVRRVWESTKETIQNGVALELIKRGQRTFVTNNLPKERDSIVAHVRPHSAKSAYLINGEIIGKLKDGNELPDGRWMTTQCFWYNKAYIMNQIKSKINKKSMDN